MSRFTKGSAGVSGSLGKRNSDISVGSFWKLLISSLLARFPKDSSNPSLRPLLRNRAKIIHENIFLLA